MYSLFQLVYLVKLQHVNNEFSLISNLPHKIYSSYLTKFFSVKLQLYLLFFPNFPPKIYILDFFFVKLQRVNDEMSRHLTGRNKELEASKSTITKCLSVVKELLIEKSRIERKDARAKCMQNRLRYVFLYTNNFEKWILFLRSIFRLGTAVCSLINL